VDAEPLSLVPRSEGIDGSVGHFSGRRDWGQQTAVRTPEYELTVRLSFYLVALVVNSTMVAATQQREVRQRGRASVGPVTDVMPLAEPYATAGEATAAVAMVQRAP
jgi:hypothetical protein